MFALLGADGGCKCFSLNSRYDQVGCSYLYDIDAHLDITGARVASKPFVIDATKYGNVARFINHRWVCVLVFCCCLFVLSSILSPCSLFFCFELRTIIQCFWMDYKFELSSIASRWIMSLKSLVVGNGFSLCFPLVLNVPELSSILS